MASWVKDGMLEASLANSSFFGNVLEVGGYLLVFGYNIIEYLAVE